MRPPLLPGALLLACACTPTADLELPGDPGGAADPGGVADPSPAPKLQAKPQPEVYEPLWVSETNDWNHGVLVLASGDVISQSMWRMRVHARHDGTVLRMARTCAALRSSAFVQTGPDRALLACDDELREYTLPSLDSRTLLRFPFDVDIAAIGTNQVAIASRDKEVAVFEIATGTELSRFKAAEDLEALALSPDGTHLALGLDLSGIVLRELSTGQWRVLIRNASAEPAWFRADGRELMAEVDSFVIGAVEIPSGRVLRTYEDSPWLSTARYIDATQVLATGAHGASLLEPDGTQTNLSNEPSEGAGVSPDGRTLCWGDRGGTITCWSKDKPAPTQLRAKPLAPVSARDPSSSATQAPSPAGAAIQRNQRVLHGTLVRKLSGDELIVELPPGGPKPGVGAKGELSKSFSQTMGNVNINGQLVIAEVEVLRVDGDELRLKITKQMSELIVNGKPIDRFVSGMPVQLSF